MRTPGRSVLALLLLAAALPGSQGKAEPAPAVPAPGAGHPAFSAQLGSAALGAGLPQPPLALPALFTLEDTRWDAPAPAASTPAFELKAPAGASVTLSQVGSTVFELSGLEVSGLGNAGNAALEQELRTGFRALDDLGQTQSRLVSLQVLSRTPTGTELSTRWKIDPSAPADLSSAASGSPELQLRQLLLPGGLRGPAEVSSQDAALAARYRLMGSAALESQSLIAGAPYGAALNAGERAGGLSQQAVLPLFRAALESAPALRGWKLPDLSSAELPPLDVWRERVYQGQNSRGDYLFQTQSRAQPWRHTLEGPADPQQSPAGRSRLTLEVLDLAQMSQAVYRADGLPHSAFEFSTLQLQVTARSGAAEVRFTVQVRSTSALRPVGS